MRFSSRRVSFHISTVLFLHSAFQFGPIHSCLVRERGAVLHTHSDFTLKSIKQIKWEATVRCDDASIKALVSIWNSFFVVLTLIAFIKHLFSDLSCFLLQLEEGQHGH